MAEQRWFETDDFWRDLQSKIYGPEQAAVAPQEAAAAIRFAGCRPPARVLDLCCGNGRHSIALASAGYQVTGVDLSPSYLAVASAAAVAAEVDVEWVCEDIRLFVPSVAYDVVLILWNAFGYFEDDAEDIAALAVAASSLKPGGALVIQTHGRESTARRFIRKDWFEIEDLYVLDQRWIESDWSRMRTHYILLTPNGPREHMISCRLYSPADLRPLLLAAGFSHVRFAGGLDGRPYGERAFELVAIARVPG